MAQRNKSFYISIYQAWECLIYQFYVYIGDKLASKLG